MKKLQPTLSTAFGDDHLLSMIKMVKGSDSEFSTESTTSYNKEIPAQTASFDGTNESSSLTTMTSTANHRRAGNPRVKAAPLANLSMDGSIMRQMMSEAQGFMQFYDAIGSDPDRIDDLASLMSKVHLEQMYESNPAIGLVETTKKASETYFEQLDNALTSPPKAIKHLRKMVDTTEEALDNFYNELSDDENFELDMFEKTLKNLGYAEIPADLLNTYETETFYLTEENSELFTNAVDKSIQYEGENLYDIFLKSPEDAQLIYDGYKAVILDTLQTDLDRFKQLHNEKRAFMRDNLVKSQHYYSENSGAIFYKGKAYTLKEFNSLNIEGDLAKEWQDESVTAELKELLLGEAVTDTVKEFSKVSASLSELLGKGDVYDIESFNLPDEGAEHFYVLQDAGVGIDTPTSVRNVINNLDREGYLNDPKYSKIIPWIKLVPSDVTVQFVKATSADDPWALYDSTNKTITLTVEHPVDNPDALATLVHETLHAVSDVGIDGLYANPKDKANAKLINEWRSLFNETYNTDIIKQAERRHKKDPQYSVLGQEMYFIKEFVAHSLSGTYQTAGIKPEQVVNTESGGSVNTQEFLNEISSSPKNIFYKTFNLLADTLKTIFKLKANQVSRLEQIEALAKITQSQFKTAGNRVLAQRRKAVKSNKPITVQQKQLQEVNSMDGEMLFDSLADLNKSNASEGHKNYLKALFKRVYGQLDSGLNIEGALRLKDVDYINISNHNKLAVQLLNSSESTVEANIEGFGWASSPEEKYTFELIKHSSDAALRNNPQLMRLALRLYNHAEKELITEGKSNLLAENPNNVGDAETFEIYNKLGAMFNVEGTQTEKRDPTSPIVVSRTRSQYLSTFLALVATNEPLRNVILRMDAPKGLTNLEGESLIEKISDAISRIINYIANIGSNVRLSGNIRKDVDNLIDALIINDTTVKSKLETAWNEKAGFASEKLNKPIHYLTDKARKSVLNSTKSDSYIDAIRKTIVSGVALADPKMAEGANALLHKMSIPILEGQFGLAGELFNETTSSSKQQTEMHSKLRYATQVGDAERKHIKESVIQVLNEELLGTTNTQREHMTYAIMMSDLSELAIQGWDITSIQDMFKSEAKLDQRIKRLEQMLKSLSLTTGKFNFYTNSVQALADYNINSKVEHGIILNTNAHNIVRELQTSDAKEFTEDLEPLRKLVDQLVTLQSIKLLHKDSPKKVLSIQEVIASNESGFTSSINLASASKKFALEQNFGNNPTLMSKGYFSEDLDPNMDLKRAPVSDAALMAEEGYTIIEKFKGDVLNPNRRMALYHRSSSYAPGYMSGIMQLANMVARGSTITELAKQYEAPVSDAKATIDKLKTENVKKANRMYSTVTSGPKVYNYSPLVPLMDDQGNLKDYRYTASNSNKDNKLGRELDFTKVLATTVSRAHSKVSTSEINSNVLDSLHAQYVEELESPAIKKYVRLAPDAENEKLKRYWDSLPSDAKVHAKSLWGKEEIYVRNDVLLVTFGDTEVDPTEVFKKKKQTLNVAEKVFRSILETLFRAKAERFVGSTYKLWKEIVGLAKDFIVVKSGAITASNILSNTLYLVSGQGMSPLSALRLQLEGVYEVTGLMKRHRELKKLNLKIKIQDLSAKEKLKMERRIFKLEAEIEANPVADLVDFGLIGSIVEDVSLDIDDDSYVEGAKRQIGKATKFLPENVKSVAKNAIMTKDSSLYKVMSDAVLYSDFGSKYALYTHMIRQGSSPKDAIERAANVFIQYDVPSHRILKFGSDIGVVWFHKYFLRIQPIILSSFARRPAQMILGTLAAQLLGAANVAESSIIAKSPLSVLGGVERVFGSFYLHPGAALIK